MLHRTEEAGEPSRGTPSREGARRATEPREGKAPGLLASSSVTTKLARIATRARERPQEVITPGRPLFFATTMAMGGDGVGLLVESRGYGNLAFVGVVVGILAIVLYAIKSRSRANLS